MLAHVAFVMVRSLHVNDVASIALLNVTVNFIAADVVVLACVVARSIVTFGRVVSMVSERGAETEEATHVGLVCLAERL